MSKLRVLCFSTSLDGFSAGPNQSLEHPLGVGGPEMFEWFFHTRTFQAMHGCGDGGEQCIDDEFAARSFENVGAWIMGRNMFGPVRGPWPDESWQGWWGEEPPYHVPVFVLTHHARAPLTMKGGTVFHFVTGGIDEALQRAREAAGDRDIRIGGGVSTIRQYLQAGLFDDLHLVVAPVLLGAGEHLMQGLDLRALGYECTEHAAGHRAAAHVILQKK